MRTSTSPHSHFNHSLFKACEYYIFLMDENEYPTPQPFQSFFVWGMRVLHISNGWERVPHSTDISIILCLRHASITYSLRIRTTISPHSYFNYSLFEACEYNIFLMDENEYPTPQPFQSFFVWGMWVLHISNGWERLSYPTDIPIILYLRHVSITYF